jgi:hypothetical protein
VPSNGDIMRPCLSRIPRGWLAAFWLCTSPLHLAAGEPTISNLNVRGLQVGGTTTLVVDGEELGKSPNLLLPFPAKQALKPGATDKRTTFDVTLDGSVVPGYYQLRIVADGGVSTPVVIGVDRLPQKPLADTLEPLPVALHSAIGGSSIVETKFTGKAGQKLLIEVEAQRLGSKLRPVLHLYGPTRLQVAWSWPSTSLFGDTRLEATLPEDGTYSVALHDAEYAVPGPGHFRLKLGQWSFVDQVFPPVIGQGQSQAVEFFGSSPPRRVDMPAPSDVGVLPLAWPKEGVWSGLRPFVVVGSQAEFAERESPGGAQDLPVGRSGTPSFAVSGRLQKPNEEDRYRIAAVPGSKLRLEVFAERYGSPLDVALVIRNDRGDLLARAEDSPGTLDPVLEYAVPGNVSSVIVGVVDAQGRGSQRGIYRLVVEPQGASSKPDFKLWTPSQAISLPLGGRRVIPVFVERRGYAGTVEVSAASLPPGVRLEGTTIPEAADGTLVTIHRGDAAANAAITTWRGRSADGQQRPIVIQGHQQERLQPWLATEIAVAGSTAKAADFQVDWRGLSADAGIILGGKLALPVKITRPAAKKDEKEKEKQKPDNSTVRLTLVTSQFPPLVNGQPDPNRSLRPEKPIEMPATDTDGAMTLLVPVELPSPVYDVAVQADLLAADKRTVLATAVTPVRRLPVRNPLVVQLAGPARIEVVLDPKKETSLKIAGKVERRDGLAGDVTITLAGLPAGARADAVTVKAAKTEFAVAVVLPANLAAGELTGLKLFATAAPDGKQPNLRVRSREVDLVIVVKPPGK